MKYAIVHVLEGDAVKYHEELCCELAREFGIKNVRDKIMPHLTLKSPFETEDINPIYRIVEDYVLGLHSFDYSIKRFGHFERDVVFLEVEPSLDLSKTATSLVDKLRGVNGMTFSSFEGKNAHFHATLGYTSNENFDDIWNYLIKKNCPSFSLEFNNITILRKTKDKWEICDYFLIQ